MYAINHAATALILFLFAAAVPGSEAPLAQHPLLVPTVILAQILLTWYFVWLFARQGADPWGDHHAST
jgi:hypothetical protein